jgi:hypothetical protein
MIIQYPVTPELHNLALNWSSFSGNASSITNSKESKYAGNLAEVMFQLLYPEAIRISQTDYEADFILNALRIDIKCKLRSVPCQLDYEVSIEERILSSNTDYYVFFSYYPSTLELLGGLSKTEYLAIAHPPDRPLPVPSLNLKIPRLLPLQRPSAVHQASRQRS